MKLHALILLEGETEEEFFKALANKYLGGVPKTFRNMKGNFNINNKIVDKIIQFSNEHPDQEFDVYICVDQEREGDPIYNEKYVTQEIEGITTCLETNDVVANIMIESLFFIDMGGLYKFLRTPNKKRNPKKYSNFRRLTHKDLTALFRQNNKMYHKGRRCQSLVENLDLDKIRKTAKEVDFFVTQLKKRHDKNNN